MNNNNITVGPLGIGGNGGVLELESTTFTIAPSGTDSYVGTITGTGTINMTGTGILQFTKTAQASIQAAAINVNSGSVQLTGASAITFSAATNFTVASGASLNFGTFGNNGADSTAFGTIANSGSVLVTAGSGTLAAASVTLTGGTIDLTGTTAAIWQFRLAGTTLTTLASSTTATLTAPTGSSFENDTGATLPIIVNAGTTASGIDLNVNGLISNGGSALTYNFDKQGAGVMQISYQGITTASFTVSAGTLIIASGSTVTGAIGVNAGKLQVNGNLTSSGTVTVASGAALEGTGTITNALSVSGMLAGGVSSGSGPNSGKLTIANSAVTFNSGSKLGVGITGGIPSTGPGTSTTQPSDNSVIAISGGSGSIDPSLTVVINATTNFTPNVPYSYLVGTGFGGPAQTLVSANSQFLLTNSPFILTPGASSLIEDSSGNLYLDFTPTTVTPEPGMLMVLAVLGIIALRFRNI